MPISWSDDWSVNVKEIDAQHQTFLKILASIAELLYRPERAEELDDLMRQLESYMLYHFATEERYFDEFDYELAEEHKAEHRDLAAQVLKYKTRYKSEGDSILPEVIDFLEDWLVDHLATQDKKYTRCFNEHGLF
ncbi:hemerythrin family protein [Candidatus Kuenenbacteria bacterium]|nr:hemerythrin family protein [Candidatus Kuenenbacteria bacterium]